MLQLKITQQAMDIEKEKDIQLITSAYQNMLKDCKRSTTPENKALIEKAYLFAKEAHKGVRRKSGEPYIIHPIEVAHIVAKELGLGTKSVVSALLHDVVEDTDYTVEDISNLFGPKVAQIVNGLTKIKGVFDQNTSMQAENFRKMLLTLSDDLRVILIKIADRLHNMRTLESMPVRKQMKIAGETLYMFAPLAHRMGLNSIKSELESLSLKYENPEEYNAIAKKLEERKEETEKNIQTIIAPVEKKLKENNIEYTIKNRPRSIYSIWDKMQKQQKTIDEIFQMQSVRVVFKSDKNLSEKMQCLKIYSIITDIYRPKPGQIKDWVSSPKSNGYEAIHVIVMGPTGGFVEFQIRSERMDNIAEKGFAVQSRYQKNTTESELDKWLKDLKEILHNPEADTMAFLDEFKLNLYTKEIQVFTPKGETIALPKYSTVLDFAYNIHTEVGDQCIGAKINHKLVPANHVLSSGDQIEVLTSEKQQPKAEWLDFVVTAKAKSNIKTAFKQKRKELMARGSKIIENRLLDESLQLNAKSIKKMVDYYKLSGKEELFYKAGTDKIDVEDLVPIVKKKSKNKFVKYWRLNFFGNSDKKKNENESAHKPEIDIKKTLLLTESQQNENYRIASCCNPIPGDKVFGYIDMANNVIIHKRKCPNALKLMSSQGDRLIAAEWKPHRMMAFLAVVQFSGIDRVGILNDVTQIISKGHDIDMRSAHFESHDGVFEGLIHLYVHNTKDLNDLIGQLIKIKSLENVKRIEDTPPEIKPKQTVFKK